MIGGMTEHPALVAIDGPVASGKTEVGRALASRLGWALFDTGIMYRALTWLALEREISLDDRVALAELARDVDVRLVRSDDPSRPDVQIEIGGVNATEHLREHHVESAVSTVAAVADVRKRLVQLQSTAAAEGRLVVVGRDIGTVVLPNAPVKIFLTASDRVRALRRSIQAGHGSENEHARVLQETQRRDERDRSRQASPLVVAEDAIELDTSEMTLEEAIEAAFEIVAAALPQTVAG